MTRNGQLIGIDTSCRACRAEKTVWLKALDKGIHVDACTWLDWVLPSPRESLLSRYRKINSLELILPTLNQDESQATFKIPNERCVEILYRAKYEQQHARQHIPAGSNS